MLRVQQLEDRSVPAHFVWTGAADGTTWEEPGNWSYDVREINKSVPPNLHYPRSGDDAEINGGTPVWQGGGLDNLELNGGTLLIEDNATLNGDAELNGGDLTHTDDFECVNLAINSGVWVHDPDDANAAECQPVRNETFRLENGGDFKLTLNPNDASSRFHLVTGAFDINGGIYRLAGGTGIVTPTANVNGGVLKVGYDGAAISGNLVLSFPGQIELGVPGLTANPVRTYSELSIRDDWTWNGGTVTWHLDGGTTTPTLWKSDLITCGNMVNPANGNRIYDFQIINLPAFNPAVAHDWFTVKVFGTMTGAPTGAVAGTNFGATQVLDAAKYLHATWTP